MSNKTNPKSKLYLPLKKPSHTDKEILANFLVQRPLDVLKDFEKVQGSKESSTSATSTSRSQVNKTFADHSPKPKVKNSPKLVRSSSSSLGSKTVSQEEFNRQSESSPKIGSSSHEAKHLTNVQKSQKTLSTSPNVVIRVVDKSKKLKQNFVCSKELLIQEMKYFADTLTSEEKDWKDVNITVHCDVNIFERLMYYIKQVPEEREKSLIIDPAMCFRMMIAADYLKIDAVVNACIQYCHDHINKVLSASSNAKKLCDRLINRIIVLFTASEAENIDDKDDIFKSKIFANLVERMFNANFKTPDCPENASSLFRCEMCGKLLTRNLEKSVRCLLRRMIINQEGNCLYVHVVDLTWDVNDFLVDLYNNHFQSWYRVYWKIWGLINYLTCSLCNSTFPCHELEQCFYHPAPPITLVTQDSTEVNGIAVHRCCQKNVFWFDPLGLPDGCKVKPHIIKPSLLTEETKLIYDTLLAHRDIVCKPYGDDYKAEGELWNSKLGCSQLTDELKLNPTRRIHELVSDEMDYLTSEDSGLEDDDRKLNSSIFSSSTNASGQSFLHVRLEGIKSWDSNQSVRFNQDAQREEDRRYMDEVIKTLTHIRHDEKVHSEVILSEYPGGLYCKLEAQWKANNMASMRNFILTRSYVGSPQDLIWKSWRQ